MRMRGVRVKLRGDTHEKSEENMDMVVGSGGGRKPRRRLELTVRLALLLT